MLANWWLSQQICENLLWLIKYPNTRQIRNLSRPKLVHRRGTQWVLLIFDPSLTLLSFLTILTAFGRVHPLWICLWSWRNDIGNYGRLCSGKGGEVWNQISISLTNTDGLLEPSWLQQDHSISIVLFNITSVPLLMKLNFSTSWRSSTFHYQEKWHHFSVWKLRSVMISDILTFCYQIIVPGQWPVVTCTNYGQGGV